MKTLLTKELLIEKGFLYKSGKGPSGADQWQGMDFWKLPYGSNKELVFRGPANHLYSQDEFNAQFDNYEELADFVFNKIKKLI